MDDVTEITQLVLRERQGRDRGWWAQMADCFHPDSRVTLSWFDGPGSEFVIHRQCICTRTDQSSNCLSLLSAAFSSRVLRPTWPHSRDCYIKWKDGKTSGRSCS